MTDRQTTYVGAVPSAKDILYAGQYSMTSIAKLAAGVLGTSTVVNGFTCTPTTPASLSVLLTAGEIYQLANLEATAWSALPADTAHSILKQGLLLDAATISITPPGTVGQSQVYLIEVQYQDSDTSNAVLNYYNSQNPNSPFYGPPVSGTGSGQAQSTVRKGVVAYQAKAGIAATTGSQTAPSVDSGWVGLFTITVAYGATTITAGNISQLTTAPFIPLYLPQVPAWVQGGTYAYGVDTGTANAMVATLTPAISAYAASLRVSIKKTASANTGAMTINLNGLGAISLTDYAGNALAAGAVPANALIEAVYDGTAFRMVGGSSSYTNSSQLSTNSGEGVAVNVPSSTVTISIASPAVVSWTAHGLAAKTAIVFSTTGALPTGLTAGTTYYVATVGLTANSFEISSTADGATVINTTGTQSGTQTCSAIGAATANLNYPALTIQNVLGNSDLFSFWSVGDNHHRAETWATLLANIKGGLLPSLLNIQIFWAVGAFTYTPTTGTRRALVIATGGGGAGGSSNGQNAICGQGGSAGQTAIAFITSPTVTGGVIGAGGIPSSATATGGTSAGSGGQTSLGSVAIAPGGQGGLNNVASGPGAPATTGGTGLFLIPGSPGQGVLWNTAGLRGGDGGASVWGPGGRGADANQYSGTSPMPGEAAPSNGAGGGGGDSGGYQAVQGGPGGQGLVFIIEMS